MTDPLAGMAGDGRVTRESTVWCSRCPRWCQEASGIAQATWREIGWRKRKGLWVCPRCIRKERP